jgi:radical SAM protein with 4Fe4S-binding SPASM domain
MKRKKGMMSDKLFRKIIKEGKEMGVMFYSPFLYGEPFLFPRIWDWLDYMQSEGIKVSLYTNAEFLDVDRLLLYNNINYVTVSLNAATEETYNKVMRGPKYEIVKKNVDELMEKASFIARVSFIRTKENRHEEQKFRSMYRHSTVGDMTNWTGDTESVRTGEQSPCWVLFNQMTILWDGKVVPCCNDYDGKMVLGDANTQHLRDIWKSYAWMREKHKNFDFSMPICKNCDYNVK